MTVASHVLPPIERRGFFEGVRAIAPAGVAIAVWGLVTGVAMVKGGMGTPWALVMTLVTFAGSAQLAVLPLLAAQAPLPVVWVTALLVNLRFVIFSAAARTYFTELPLRQRLLSAYLNGDLGFALFSQRFGDEAERGTPYQWGYFYGAACLNWIVWQVASIAGILLAGLLPTDWGLELAAVLALVAVVIPMLTGRPALIGVLVTGVVSVALAGLPLKLGLPVAVLVGVGVAVAIEPGADDPARQEAMS